MCVCLRVIYSDIFYLGVFGNKCLCVYVCVKCVFYGFFVYFTWVHWKQMWDKDLLKWNDCIAEGVLDLGKYFRRAYKKKNEILKLFESEQTEKAQEALVKTQQALASEQVGRIFFLFFCYIAFLLLFLEGEEAGLFRGV